MLSLFHDSRFEKDAGNKANWVFLVLEIFVKMFPLSGKEQIRNYRKKWELIPIKKNVKRQTKESL